MNEIQKMYCPSCGAPVQFLPGREDAFCSSCGSQLFKKDDHLEIKLKHEEAKMEYADRHEEREFKRETAEREAKEEKNAIIGCISICTVVLILVVLLFWFMMTHPA